MEFPNFFCIFDLSTFKHNNMISQIKFRLLSYLFEDWVQKEENLDVLIHAKYLIEEREFELDSPQLERTIIQGFKRYDN